MKGIVHGYKMPFHTTICEYLCARAFEEEEEEEEEEEDDGKIGALAQFHVF